MYKYCISALKAVHKILFPLTSTFVFRVMYVFTVGSHYERFNSTRILLISDQGSTVIKITQSLLCQFFLKIKSKFQIMT